MSSNAEPPAPEVPAAGKPRRRNSEEVLREVLSGCGLMGFVVGILAALVNEVTSTVDGGDQRLKGMFTALTLLSMGVLIQYPRVRGFVWLIVALYACYMLLALLALGR